MASPTPSAGPLAHGGEPRPGAPRDAGSARESPGSPQTLRAGRPKPASLLPLDQGRQARSSLCHSLSPSLQIEDYDPIIGRVSQVDPLPARRHPSGRVDLRPRAVGQLPHRQ